MSDLPSDADERMRMVRVVAAPFNGRLVNLDRTEVERRYRGRMKWSDIKKSGEVPKHWPPEPSGQES